MLLCFFLEVDSDERERARGERGGGEGRKEEENGGEMVTRKSKGHTFKREALNRCK